MSFLYVLTNEAMPGYIKIGITALSVTNVGFLIHTAVTRLRREFATERP